MRLSRTCAVMALVAAGLLYSGCAAPNGWANMGHATVTTLKANNFTVTDTNTQVEASCPILFGFSANVAGIHLGMGGIPLGDYELWKRCMNDLSKKAGAKQIVNVTSDYTVVSYFGIFNIHTLTLTADLVEFGG